MSYILIFLCFFIGIAFKKSFLALGIVFTFLFIKTVLAHRKRLSLAMLGVFLIGFGISFIRISYPNKTNYVGIVYEVKDNYFLYNSNGEKLYCYEKNNKREVGDILSIKGNKEQVDFTTLESDFDFNNYLKNKGVYSILNIKDIRVKFSNPIRLKSFKNYFLNKFDESAMVSVGSILFSEHDDNQLVNDISSMHLSRLINAGGLYINALFSLLMYFLEKKIKTKYSKLITFGISSFYIILNLGRFSILRISFLYIFKWINDYLLNKKFKYLELIAISGIIFLIFDYSLAYQDSFILGYTLPICLFLINNSFSFLSSIKRKVITVIAIYLFFIPFELKYYHSVSPLLMIYQSILIPLFILFFYISLLCLYGLPIYKIVNVYNDLLSKIVNPFSKLTITMFAPEMNNLLVVVYYAVILLIFYYSSIRCYPYKKIFLYSYIAFIPLYFLPIKNVISSEVTFVNVGQGDCCFIRNRNTTVLIDTGGLTYKDLATDCLIPFLKKKRVYDLDLVITTHQDFDHYGALASLTKHFKVKRTMDNSNFKTTSFANLTFKNYNNHINPKDEENEKSLVIGFNLGNKDYLITGDATINIENNMMKEYDYIPCDILKVGHHGSNTSTSDAFIKWLKPEVGVISCGKNNKYGHPHQEVLRVLKNNGVKIRRTDLEGSITYFSYSFFN